MSEEEVKTPKVKKSKERYAYEEVVTQTGRVLKDSESGIELSQEEMNLTILNKLDRIERSVA